MPKVSMKRQITLPIDQCKQIGIQAGDEYESYIYENRITIIKKSKGAARGMLKNVKVDKTITDLESLQSSL